MYTVHHYTCVNLLLYSVCQDVYGFRLAGQPIVYHCRLRPHAREFLDKVSKLYELHVFTMATKDYAAAVIDILDPNKHLFCDRIITRHEFFDPRSKALRFKYVVECGIHVYTQGFFWGGGGGGGERGHFPPPP